MERVANERERSVPVAHAPDELARRIDELATEIRHLLEVVSRASECLEPATALDGQREAATATRQVRGHTALAPAVQQAEDAMARQEWPEAAAAWQDVLQAFPDRAPARVYEALSVAQRRLGRLDEAEAIVTEGCTRFPDAVALRIERAYAAMARHDWLEAVARWETVLACADGAVPDRVYAQLGAAHRRLRRFEAAEAVIEQGRARHREAMVLDVEQIRLAVGRGDWPEAVACAHATLDRHGDRAPVQVYVELSQAHRSLGHFEAAAAAVSQGELKHQGSVALARERVEVAFGRQDWHEVVARATAMLAAFGERVPARVLGHLHVAHRSLGNHEAADAVFVEYLRRKERVTYTEWIARNDTLSDRDRSLIRSHITSFGRAPTISIVMAVGDPRPDFLREAIDSVLSQLYERWELCVVGDASASGAITGILEEYARRDARIRLHVQATREGLAACRTAALGMASGDWVMLLDDEDRLSEHALYLVAEALSRRPDSGIVYGDEDQVDGLGRRSDPLFKPDWDYDQFLARNLLDGLTAYRADVARGVGHFRRELEGADIWDFALRAVERVPATDVHHVPFVLYHRRRRDGQSPREPAPASDAVRDAVNDHLTRTGRGARAIQTAHPDRLRIEWRLASPRPLASIIIPTRDQCAVLRGCIDGILHRTTYRPVEIIVVDNGSRDPEALAYLGELASRDGVEVLDASGPFNFSRLVNLGVAASSGPVSVLLNNDVDVINADWLDEMVSHALRPEVGAVGAKLYYGNETIQHAGVVLGLGASGVAGHAHRFFPRQAAGYGDRLTITHSVSCVTGACLATRRDVYDAVGGFNEQDLTVALNDVDFCLRVRQAGHTVIWTPYAELYHFESVSRRTDSAPAQVVRLNAERTFLRRHWRDILDNDPFYSPNLDLDGESFDLAISTRARKPWLLQGPRPEARVTLTGLESPPSTPIWPNR